MLSFSSVLIIATHSLFTCVFQQALAHFLLDQNAAARLLKKTIQPSHITPILTALHWLLWKFRIPFKILLIAYKALHSQAPCYKADLLRPYFSSWPLRLFDQSLLTVPSSYFKTRGDHRGFLKLCNS